MAMTKLPNGTFPPVLMGGADYQRVLVQLAALGVNLSSPRVIDFDNDEIFDGVLLFVGGSYYKSVGATSIAGSPTKYVKVVPDGDTATAEYVASLAGVAWNSDYCGYYDSDEPANLYLFDEAEALKDSQIASIKTTIPATRVLRATDADSADTAVLLNGRAPSYYQAIYDTGQMSTSTSTTSTVTCNAIAPGRCARFGHNASFNWNLGTNKSFKLPNGGLYVVMLANAAFFLSSGNAQTATWHGTNLFSTNGGINFSVSWSEVSQYKAPVIRSGGETIMHYVSNGASSTMSCNWVCIIWRVA